MDNSNRWTKEEDDFLIRCYDCTNLEEVAKEIPDRTLIAIKSRIVRLQKKKLIKVRSEKNQHLKDDERICGVCGEIKNISEFSGVKGKHVKHTCKLCNSERVRLAELKIKEEKQHAKYKNTVSDIERRIKENQAKTYLCRVCKKELPGTEFYYSKQTGYRVGTSCKKCDSARRNEAVIKKIKNSRGNS